MHAITHNVIVCVSMTSTCSLNRNTTLLENWQIMETTFLGPWPKCPSGYAHGVMAVV